MQIGSTLFPIQRIMAIIDQHPLIDEFGEIDDRPHPNYFVFVLTIMTLLCLALFGIGMVFMSYGMMFFSGIGCVLCYGILQLYFKKQHRDAAETM